MAAPAARGMRSAIYRRALCRNRLQERRRRSYFSSRSGWQTTEFEPLGEDGALSQEIFRRKQMASFYIPLTGLESDSTALNTIANDLANLNTTGFKDQTVNFSDLFY